MPESYDREGLIDRATDAINGGDPERALGIADEIRKGEGPNADEALIRGIALSSLGRIAEASDAFAEAIRRAPNSHKARFNAAVHEFNAGNLAGARELAAQAIAIDPAHGSTRELAIKIEEAAKPPRLEADPEAGVTVDAIPSSAAMYARPADDEEPLPWIRDLGPRWVMIGLIIAGLSFLTFLGITAMALASGSGAAPRTISEAVDAGSKAAQSLQRVPAYQLLSLFDLIMRMASIGWTVLDLVRRRGNFLWLVAVVPLSCLSFVWIGLPIYILFGRKPERPS